MPDLIVNADDFGRTEGINRGILEAHTAGIVTSTTAMMTYPASGPGLEAALAEAPDLGLGVHLNLTSGRPLLPAADVPSLVDDAGFFYRPDRLSEVMPTWAPDDLAAELNAQVDRFLRLTGQPPTHLDSHHHAVAMYPSSVRVMLELAQTYGISIRRPPFSRTPSETRLENWVLRNLPEDEGLRAATALHELTVEFASVCMPAYFVSSFYDHQAILGELLVILTTLATDGVTELMCHPGYASGLDSPYAAPRERELAVLTHSATHEVAAAEGIHLMTFAELPRCL